MRLKDIKKEIKGVFLQPKRTYYFGRLHHGSPYFYPIGFHRRIFSVRRLKKRSEEEYSKHVADKPWLEKERSAQYSNYPMVNRNYSKIVKIFNRDYLLTWGSPITFSRMKLGWKEKYDTPRFEFSPAYQINFFGLQYQITWVSPIDPYNSDKYWEQIIWYLRFCDKDINKARESWSWRNVGTKESTWSDEFLVKTK